MTVSLNHARLLYTQLNFIIDAYYTNADWCCWSWSTRRTFPLQEVFNSPTINPQRKSYNTKVIYPLKTLKWDQNHSSKFDKKPQKPKFQKPDFTVNEKQNKQTKKSHFDVLPCKRDSPFPQGIEIYIKKFFFCFYFYFSATIIFGLTNKYRGTANGTPSRHCRRRRMKFLIILTTCWFTFFPLDISMNFFFLAFNNSQMQPQKTLKKQRKKYPKKGIFHNKLWITSLSNLLKREMMNLRFIAPVWPFHLRNNRQ